MSDNIIINKFSNYGLLSLSSNTYLSAVGLANSSSFRLTPWPPLYHSKVAEGTEVVTVNVFCLLLFLLCLSSISVAFP